MAEGKTVAEAVEAMAAEFGVADIPANNFALAITRLDGFDPDRTVRLLAGLLAIDRMGLGEYIRLAERHLNERS